MATPARRVAELGVADLATCGTTPSASPFLKWVGGKGRILAQLRPLLPAGVELMRHVEPFVGGGALFFSRAPGRALLGDVNAELIATYQCVQRDVESLIDALAHLARDHSVEAYYAVRTRYNQRGPMSPVERAAHFIYLNKTCFNGLHRVNRRGEFNVPAGRYTAPRIVDAPGLRAASRTLATAELTCQPFEALLAQARPGDFIYFDPPYEPVSRTATFTAYAESGFSRDDQARLAEVYRALDRRGCRLMLSNSDVPLIRELYRGYQIDVVAAPRAVNCDPTRRGRVTEVVVRNYEVDAGREPGRDEERLRALLVAGAVPPRRDARSLGSASSVTRRAGRSSR